MRGRCRTIPLLLALAVWSGAACSDPLDVGPGDVGPGDGTAIASAESHQLSWARVADGVDRAVLAVPLDHDDPGGPTIDLAVTRHRATDAERRIGVLFVNPGGPGANAAVLAEQAPFVYGATLTAVFDVVAVDPRGTGRSEPHVDCVDDLDPTFAVDTSPDDVAEETALLEAARAFAAGCVSRSGELLAHVDTVAAARDLDLVRRALGEERVSWFGWSYGTALGVTWASLHPESVRAVVLDGAIDPTLSRSDGLLAQAAGFERTLSAFLAWCTADPTCAFGDGGDAAVGFDELAASIDRASIPTRPDRPDLSDGLFDLAVVAALYDEAAWPLLGRALAAAAAGDGSVLLPFYDGSTGRLPGGGNTDEIEAYVAISCADDPPTATGAPSLGDARSRRDDLALVAPRIGPAIAYELLVCESFPPGTFGTADAPVALRRPADVPVLVIGTTGDPATPIEGGRLMAEQLDAAFVEVDAWTHTAYGTNACVDGIVEDLLVSLVVPTTKRC